MICNGFECPGKELWVNVGHIDDERNREYCNVYEILRKLCYSNLSTQCIRFAINGQLEDISTCCAITIADKARINADQQ